MQYVYKEIFCIGLRSIKFSSMTKSLRNVDPCLTSSVSTQSISYIILPRGIKRFQLFRLIDEFKNSEALRIVWKLTPIHQPLASVRRCVLAA